MGTLIAYIAALAALLFGTAFMLATAVCAAAAVASVLAAIATAAGQPPLLGWAAIDWLLIVPFALGGYAIFKRLFFALVTR